MILAIESATPRGSVALVSGGVLLAEIPLAPGRQASVTYLTAVEGLFAASGSAPGDVSCVAVSAGPGSFTGLRVGMSAAKGFCFGWGVPLASVPTLLALAHRFPGEGRTVCPVLDARRSEVYAAFFRWEGGELVRLSPDMAVAPSSLPGRLPEGDILFCGDGVAPFGGLFREALGDRATLVAGDGGLAPGGGGGRPRGADLPGRRRRGPPHGRPVLPAVLLGGASPHRSVRPGRPGAVPRLASPGSLTTRPRLIC